MKRLLILFLLIWVSSCSEKPILQRNEYEIVDTLAIVNDNFDNILGYNLIIKYGSSYHYALMDEDANIVYVEVKKIKPENWK